MELKYKLLNGAAEYRIREDGAVFKLKEVKSKNKRRRDTSFEWVRVATYKYKDYITIQIKGERLYLHRLIASMYCDNNHPESNTHVHHKDEDTTNNHYTNLEWLTPEKHKGLHLLDGQRIARWIGQDKATIRIDLEVKDKMNELKGSLSYSDFIASLLKES